MMIVGWLYLVLVLVLKQAQAISNYRLPTARFELTITTKPHYMTVVAILEELTRLIV